MLKREAMLMEKKVLLQDELFAEEEGTRSAFRVLERIAEVEVQLAEIRLYEYTLEEEEMYWAQRTLRKAIEKLYRIQRFLASL